jgi:hypothetical protein
MPPAASEAPAGQAPVAGSAAGQVQSPGVTPGRRRRRRRKSKSGGPQAGPPQASQQSRPAPNPQPSQNGHRRPPGQNRFPAKNGSPGNGNGQGRRKNKQRRQQVFVGPMDHSYRTANGNVADAPPSTIPLHGHGRGTAPYFPELMSNEPAAPEIREDAPTRVYCFIDDLFFLAKIQETARKLGVKVAFLKGDKESVAGLLEAEEAPALVVFDLNSTGSKPMTLMPKIKAKFKKGTSVVGFLSHLQGDLKLKALESGCDTVMPRSAFSQSLPNLLRRYGLEEEEEYSPQPVD